MIWTMMMFFFTISPVFSFQLPSDNSGRCGVVPFKTRPLHSLPARGHCARKDPCRLPVRIIKAKMRLGGFAFQQSTLRNCGTFASALLALMSRELRISMAEADQCSLFFTSLIQGLKSLVRRFARQPQHIRLYECRSLRRPELMSVNP